MSSPWCSSALRPNGSIVKVMPDFVGSSHGLSFDGSIPVDLPEGPLFTRAAASNDHIFALFKGGTSGHAWLVRDDGARRDLGPTHGNFPVGIACTPESVVCVIQTSPTEYVRHYLSQGSLEGTTTMFLIPPHSQGTSQGFLGLDAQFTPQWKDPMRGLSVQGVNVSYYTPMGSGWFVGQADPPQIVVFNHNAIGAAYYGDCEVPHGVATPETWLVALPTPNGPLFAGPGDAKPVLRPEKPVDPIDPPPTEKPMLLPAAIVDLANRMHAAFPDLAKSRDEEVRRKLTLMFAQQVRYTTNDDDWGTKRALGRPQSKDGLAHRTTGDNFYMWDWQDGTTLAVALTPGQPGTLITDQEFIAVDPVNHLADTQEPGGGDNEEPPVDVAQLTALLTSIRDLSLVQQEALKGLTTAIQQLTQVVGSLITSEEQLPNTLRTTLQEEIRNIKIPAPRYKAEVKHRLLGTITVELTPIV